MKVKMHHSGSSARSVALTLTLAVAVLITCSTAAAAAVVSVHSSTTSERSVFYDREAETLKCKLLLEGCRLTELGASPEYGADELCPANATGLISSPSYDEGWYVHCACDEGFKPSADKRTCLRKRIHGESCELLKEEVDPCNTDQHEGCQRGACGCAEGRTRDSLNGQCKLKVGQLCQRRDDVTESPCSRFASCEGAPQLSRCACQSGYKAEGNGTCVGHEYSDCLLNEDCPSEQGLVCFNHKCRCRHPRDQIYDWGPQKCMILIGASCDASPAAFPGCSPTSYCKTTENSTAGVCSCASDQKPTVGNRSCYGILENYGESCMDHNLVRAPTKSGVRPGSSVCDLSKGLACVNGSCGCAEPSAVYEAEADVCAVPPGGRCGEMEVEGSCVGGAGGVKQCEHYRLPCAKEAYCDEGGRCKLHMLTFASQGDIPLIHAGHRDDGDPLVLSFRADDELAH